MNSGKQTAKSSQVKSPENYWLVPRGWFIGAMLVPLLALGTFVVVQVVLRSAPLPAVNQLEPGEATADSGAVARKPGPWGELEIAPITIAPPLEFIPADDERSATPDILWHFQDLTVDGLALLLAQAGLDQARQAAILDTSRDDPSIHGVVVKPPPEVIRGLSPQERERIYMALTRCVRNDRQQNAFRFYGPSPDDWFRNAPITAATQDLVRPFIFSHDGFLLFADIDLVADRIRGEERRRLFKTLFRETTCLVKLHVPKNASVDAIVEYWGRGGRRLDVRPLIESAAQVREGYPVDITHLLPQFARQHLYRYPRVTLADLSRQDFMNCFWSALNFFNEQPDDRFLDLKVVTQTIQRDYYMVHDNFNLGDLVLFSDGAGSFYHAAVYIADGLVFGKNGNSPLSPWIITPLERVKGYYPQYADTGRIQYFRRRE